MSYGKVISPICGAVILKIYEWKTSRRRKTLICYIKELVEVDLDSLSSSGGLEESEETNKVLQRAYFSIFKMKYFFKTGMDLSTVKFNAKYQITLCPIRLRVAEKVYLLGMHWILN